MKMQYRVVRETETEQRGVHVMADNAHSVWVARAIARRDNWPGVAHAWLVYQDLRQWHPVHSESEPH